jgi:RNA polymerase sigma-70 factor (ECF subfamily)
MKIWQEELPGKGWRSIMIMEKCLLQKKNDEVLPGKGSGTETEVKEEITCGERSLVKRLKAGDEAAFIQIVEMYHTLLLRLARSYVRSQSSAEEVVQETWMGVFQRLPFFEERSSLKTWITRILINRARTWAVREQRLVPFSSLIEGEEESDMFVAEPEHLSGGWISLVEDRHGIPEACLLSLETHTCVTETIEALPANQRAVIVLCDIEGREPEEICTRLGISMVNQRVLLHRARTRVRRILEQYFESQ